MSRKPTEESHEITELHKDQEELVTAGSGEAEESEPEEAAVTAKDDDQEPELKEEEPDESPPDELQQTKERLLRLQAEFQNYKRRVEKEKSTLYAFGCEELARDILPVIDNFERALNTMKEREDELYTGIDMIRQQLVQVLEKHNITEIDALNQPFDMHLHHAVMTEPCETEEQQNTVAEVMQKGYLLKGRVLRPSMVKVYQS
ncbi:MAG: nucleotide exchange factor GrpE [Bacillota bacterium]|nr:nucleotide exchange factor GrpE [Bacillota bacterium]MDW7678150.1 nucleotide exchange factor GrpE [Bacillota bacterium]